VIDYACAMIDGDNG